MVGSYGRLTRFLKATARKFQDIVPFHAFDSEPRNHAMQISSFLNHAEADVLIPPAAGLYLRIGPDIEAAFSFGCFRVQSAAADAVWKAAEL